MSLVLLALHSDEGRLAAILAADIAGYSRLMGQDETQALRDLEGHEDIVLLVTQTCCLDHRARCAQSNAPLHPEGHGRAQLHAPRHAGSCTTSILATSFTTARTIGSALKARRQFHVASQ
jgi:hypothetical protein